MTCQNTLALIGWGFSFADDAECVRYIISTNIHRRHLTNEQRDQIGARLVTMQAGGDGGASPQNAGTVGIGIQAAAALVQSTPARIERARTIERADPKLAEKVISGEISKGAALRQIKHTQERSKPLPAVTDYANADDSVIDKKEEACATGWPTCAGCAGCAPLVSLVGKRPGQGGQGGQGYFC